MKIPRYGKLSARLRELGLSQTDLAYALRLSPGAISQRMQGTEGVYGLHRLRLSAGIHRRRRLQHRDPAGLLRDRKAWRFCRIRFRGTHRTGSGGSAQYHGRPRPNDGADQPAAPRRPRL